MRFYEFIDKKNQKKFLLPFKNHNYFFEYLLDNGIKIQSYKVINKSYRLEKRKLMIFTYNLISLLENKIDIILSLELISKQEEKIFSTILWNIKKDIENGNSLHNSFKRYKEIFPTMYLNLLSIGEKTNQLVINLQRNYKSLKFQLELNEKIKKATFYPLIITFFLVCLLIFIFIFVVPNFEIFFEESELELPTVTKIIIFISKHFFYILMVILSFLAIIFLVIRFISKEKKEIILFNIPVLKFFLRNQIKVDFSENFYLMLEANLNVIEALEILLENSKYIFLKKEITNIKESIMRGRDMYNSFKSTNILDYEDLKLLKIAEESQGLSKAFEIIAIIAQNKIEKKLFKITTLMQPVLLLILGIIVSTVLLAVYLPMFNISSSII